MLEVRDLTKRFGDNVVLDRLNFNIGNNEFVSIVGHSGCGKSTLLNCLAGLESFEGSASVAGQQVVPGRVSCGVVFQDYALFPWLTVEQNVRFGLRFTVTRNSRREMSERVEALLAMMDLSDFRGLYPRQLSGGMRQRVAIARSLIIDPPVLLMDEPFASLDALTRRRLGSELLNIWKTTKKVIILVTHSASEAVLLSDRVMILHGGRVRHVEHIDVPRPRTLSQKIIGEKIDFVERTLADLQTEKKSGLE